jgi:hypothetical protein
VVVVVVGDGNGDDNQRVLTWMDALHYGYDCFPPSPAVKRKEGRTEKEGRMKGKGRNRLEGKGRKKGRRRKEGRKEKEGIKGGRNQVRNQKRKDQFVYIYI